MGTGKFPPLRASISVPKTHQLSRLSQKVADSMLMNGCSCILAKLYLWTLKFQFRRTVTCHKIFFFWFFSQPFKKLKPFCAGRLYEIRRWSDLGLWVEFAGSLCRSQKVSNNFCQLSCVLSNSQCVSHAPLMLLPSPADKRARGSLNCPSSEADEKAEPGWKAPDRESSTIPSWAPLHLRSSTCNAYPWTRFSSSHLQTKNTNKTANAHPSFQFSSVTQSCLTLCDPLDCRMPGFPVHHQLPELTQTHAH